MSLSFLEAIPRNRMAMLGDMMVATTPPLAFRAVADPQRPRALDGFGRVTMTIGNIELYCNGQRIDDHLEQQLAFYFMLHSDWVTEERARVVDNDLIYLEYCAEPRQATPNQDFQILGYLSDMVSRYYNDLTAPDGDVVRLSPTIDPGNIGVLIPPRYQGKQLPLWRFTVAAKGLEQ